MPEGGRKLRHRKLLPNRNWCYFESVPAAAGLDSYDEGDAKGDGHTNQPGDKGANGNGVGENGATDKEKEKENGAPKVQKAVKPGQVEEDLKHEFWRNSYAFTKSDPYPTTLGPTSSERGIGSQQPRLHEHSGGIFCRHEKGFTGQGVGKGVEGDLRLRLWLESSLKTDRGRRFASYDVVVPPLEVPK